jgi:hypothetical protein
MGFRKRDRPGQVTVVVFVRFSMTVVFYSNSTQKKKKLESRGQRAKGG